MRPARSGCEAAGEAHDDRRFDGSERGWEGEAARILVARGLVYHSLSDVVREEASDRGLDHERETLIRVGNDLRERFGAGVLAVRIASRLEREPPPPRSGVVVDSIRSPPRLES